ncbi:NUDIX domain-containing protein [bacterium]|nr:NUDIX domain-containing protein [bacterium]
MLKICLIFKDKGKEMRIGNTKIKIVQKNIFKQFVEAIVVFTDNDLALNEKEMSFIRKGKVFAGIKKKFVVGKAIALPIDKLPIKYAICSVLKKKSFEINKEKIKLAIRDVLKVAEEKKINSIAFSVLWLQEEISLKEFSRIMIGEISKYLEKMPFLKEIVFILPDKKKSFAFRELVTDCIGYIEREKGAYPIPTVDIIIELKEKIVLIKRKNPPYGWAIPGGFVEYDESLEVAAAREAKEETNLSLQNLFQFHTYSEPGRDPRFHTISTVFIAQGKGNPEAKSDALELGLFSLQDLPGKFAFDHKKIIRDYFNFKKNGLAL